MNINVNTLVLAAGIAIGAAGSSWLHPAPARAAEPQRSTAVFEYKVDTLKGLKQDADLNERARDGWEPVMVTDPGRVATYLFRRQVPAGQARPQ